MSIVVNYTEQTESGIIVIDGFGNMYSLPKGFQVVGDEIRRRRNVVRMAFSHGGMDIGDGMLEPRKISISGPVYADTEGDFQALLDEILYWLNKDDIFIRAGSRQIKIERISGVSLRYNERPAYAKVDIGLVAGQPFWVSTTERIKEFNLAGGGVFAITVGGTAPAYPLIEIENNADNTNIILTNETDNRQFQIQDPQALAGTKITIDCEAGTVYRDDTNILHFLSGRFLRLLPNRENSIHYQGANAVLRFKYREAYL